MITSFAMRDRDPLRCLNNYRLDPARAHEAYIVPEAILREHREQAEELIRIGRSGLENLFSHVAEQNYVLLLSDARGVTVDLPSSLRGLTSAEEVRHLDPLPETTDEACPVARLLGADPSHDVYLGAKATKAQVKALASLGLDEAAGENARFRNLVVWPPDAGWIRLPAWAEPPTHMRRLTSLRRPGQFRRGFLR